MQVVGKAPEAIKYAAFITTITLSNEQGFPVPQGYHVNVSSKDPTIALINNQTYCLGNKAEISLTDDSGYVSIIIPVSNDAISCSELGVWLQSPINPIQVSEVFPIEPAQRVVNTLRQVTSGSDIFNAKRSNGKPVFANKAAVDRDAVNTTADVISKLPQFRTQGQSGSTQGSIIILGNAGKEPLEWFVTDEGQETTPNLLGDNIESMKQYVKEKVQAVMKVVGPVVKFVVKIFGEGFSLLS